jgi:response regulator RpfG family c-di-GMP phosphodiesterase
MEKASLLILDDEKEVLNALNRVLRKNFFNCIYFQIPTRR